MRPCSHRPRPTAGNGVAVRQRRALRRILGGSTARACASCRRPVGRRLGRADHRQEPYPHAVAEPLQPVGVRQARDSARRPIPARRSGSAAGTAAAWRPRSKGRARRTAAADEDPVQGPAAGSGRNEIVHPLRSTPGAGVVSQRLSERKAPTGDWWSAVRSPGAQLMPIAANRMTSPRP